LLKLPHVGFRGVDALYQEVEKQGKTYNKKLLEFVLYMKYIWTLYCLTIHFEKLIYNIENFVFIPDLTNSSINELFSPEIVNFIKEKYYIDNILKENTDYTELTIEYILYFNNNNIFASDFEISIFKLIFREPNGSNDTNDVALNITDDNFKYDKYFISNKRLTELSPDNKALTDFMKKHRNVNNVYDITVILQNNIHFIFCLFEDEMFFEFDEHGNVLKIKREEGMLM
jgi:hypothetical protein